MMDMIPVKEADTLVRASEPAIGFNLTTGDIFELDESGVAVLNRCDGRNSVSVIADQTGTPLDEVQEFLATLEESGLIHFMDPDICFELKKVSQIEIEDEISISYNLKFRYDMGDRLFKKILIETSFVTSFYLLALKDRTLVGLSELFLLDALDPDTLYFYQPHLLQKESYAQNARQLIEEILEKAKECGKKKVEALNISDGEIQKILTRMGFSQVRTVVTWNMDLAALVLNPKLEKNIRYYERKAEKDNVVIRPITRKDIPHLVELYKSLSQTKKDLYTVCFANPEIFEKLFELKGFDSELCLLAEKDGILLGYHVWMWKDEETVEWWISRVNPEGSTYGVIDLLFNQVIMKAQKKGAHRASLGWNSLDDRGLCQYKWKWGAIPAQCFRFMRKIL